MSGELNPYEAPQSALGPARPVQGLTFGGPPIMPFASARTRAAWAVGLLAMTMVVTVLSMAVTYTSIQGAEAQMAGRALEDEDTSVSELMMYVSLALLVIATGLGSSIAFLMWIHRVHRNLPSLGATDLRFTPGWAVGWFFVPIMNLFRPCQVMREVWRESDSAALAPDPWSGNPSPPTGSSLVGWWWALYLIMNVVNQAAFRASMRAETPETTLVAEWISLAGDLITFPAAIVAIRLVQTITKNQENRHGLLAGVDPFEAGRPTS